MPEAKEAYQHALKLDTSNTDALFRLGAIAITNNDKVGMNEVKLAIAVIDKELAEEYSHMMECGIKC